MVFGLNQCKQVMFGKLPSPSCCERVRVSHMECVCPVITPKLAAFIDVNRAIRLIEGCGRRVPRHLKCGMLVKETKRYVNPWQAGKKQDSYVNFWDSSMEKERELLDWKEYGTLHIKASFGPPFGLIQGTLEAQGTAFKQIPTETCPITGRGSVAWFGSGPEFFISVAKHPKWKNACTVFGSILPEDMKIAEKIAQLPTQSDVLKKPVPLMFRRLKTNSRSL